MFRISMLFPSRKAIILAGGFFGIAAPILHRLGNPTNMGICVACMECDIADAPGFHCAGIVQYVWPEIIGFMMREKCKRGI